MARQPASPGLWYAVKKKRTRREKLRVDMEAVVPWTRLLALIEPHYPNPGPKGGRPPMPMETMLLDKSTPGCSTGSSEGWGRGRRGQGPCFGSATGETACRCRERRPPLRRRPETHGGDGRSDRQEGQGGLRRESCQEPGLLVPRAIDKDPALRPGGDDPLRVRAPAPGCTHMHHEPEVATMAPRATVTFHTTPETRERLARLARLTKRSTSFLSNEAVERYLAEEEAFVAAVEDGIAQAEAGALIDHDTAVAHLRQRDEDRPLPAPSPTRE